MTEDSMRVESIESLIPSLEEHKDKIRSLVQIGSTVFGLNEKGSDIDVVVICTDEGYKPVNRVLYERMTENFKFQYSVYKPSRIERIFMTGSPFANSIRHGVVLKDDGFLKGLIENKEFPLKPTQEYYLDALNTLVYLRYYAPIMDIEKEIREDHGPKGMCIKSGECQGHSPGDLLATGLFRMLYITLPYRGCMPLSKADVVRFAGEVYGKRAVGVLNKCVEILRNDRWGVTIDEYILLKPFAVELFRECLRIVDARNNGDMLKTLRDAAGTARLVMGLVASK